MTRSVLRQLVPVLLLLALVACASGSTTTTAEPTTTVTTTAAPATTAEGAGDDPGSVGSLSDMPQECLDAFDAFLRDIEPIVADFDFDNATLDDFEALGEELDAIAAPMEEITADCPDLDVGAEESLQLMIDYARDVAPGTVPYFEAIAEFAGSFEGPDLGAISGDCETDIEAVMVFVDAGTSMNELTLAEATTVGSLMTSISTNCSAERFQEFVSDPDVAAFLGG
jgi:hypothetical protein